MWRDESTDFATLNLHCLEIDVYRDASGWHLECQSLSIKHMSLPTECDTLDKAKREGLKRVNAKLNHFVQLGGAILAHMKDTNVPRA